MSDRLDKIYAQFGVEKRKESLQNIDSLKRIMLIVAIEEEFGVSFPAEFMKIDMFCDSKAVIEIIKSLRED